MTSPRPDDPRVLFMADTFFKSLVSATRAKEVSLYYYRRELEKQRATEQDLRRVSLIYAIHFIEGINKIKESANADIGDKQIQDLVVESIEYVKEKFKSE